VQASVVELAAVEPVVVLLGQLDYLLLQSTLFFLHIFNDPLNDTTLTRSVHDFFHLIIRCWVNGWKDLF
jgi:hypothetical protein